jgi:hypothetical protein
MRGCGLAWLSIAVGATLALGGCVAGHPVTGTARPTSAFTQSETAAATAFASGTKIAVVTYNDGTDPDGRIEYTSTTRTIKAGASHLGWSYSTDAGKTWSYGGRVPPPPGWAALWGDPAIVTSRTSYAVMFITSLAIPDAKMPAQGISGSVIISGAQSYIGGACIARSTDGGKTFANYQCVSNTAKNSTPDSEKGHFYDGGSLAASKEGAVFAAFNDVTENAIDVWRAASHSGQFQLLPDPFPEMAMVSHPRLRSSPFDDSVYVAAQSSNGQIFINRYRNGAWGAPRSVAGAQVYPCIEFEADGCSGAFSTKLRVRTGPQFSYDVGAADDAEGRDAIRFLFTVKDGPTGRFHLRAATCKLDISDCYGWTGTSDWGTLPSSRFAIDAFNPNVRAWPGFIGLPPVWMTTFNYRFGLPANGIYVARATLAYLPNGDRLYFPIDLVKNAPICPDQRGYWGDYDDLELLGFKDDVPQWLRPRTDSGPSCATRWYYTSDPVHVRALVFPE